MKVADDNIAKVKAFLNAFSNQAINSLATNSKLAGAITKPKVLKLIRATSGYSALTSAQKALIIKGSISISKDPTRTQKVTMTFKDETSKILKGYY